MLWGHGGFRVVIALCHILKRKEAIRKQVGLKKIDSCCSCLLHYEQLET